MSLESAAESLCLELPSGLDLTDGADLERTDRATAALLEVEPDVETMARLERRFAGRRDAPLMLQLAIKLARSRMCCVALERPCRVSVVFAMYKEHQRILSAEEHPYGENFLVRKVAQMERLFAGLGAFEWELIAVDDGCPEGSGRLAQQIVEREGLSDRVRVLFLEEAIREGLAVTSPMTSAADSQKGGSIAYGMWAATQSGHDHQVVVFTDADLSTHLGQVGLLLDAISSGHDVAIGSRREPESIVVKTGVRNSRGKLFIYLWKRLLEPLGYIVDTQCGFKAFTGDTVRSVVADLDERRFAIDLELLLRAELRRPGCIAKVAIGWIDSEAASTTTDLQPYLPMLESIVTMYRRHLAASPEADAFADFIEQLDDAAWARLVDHIPVAIADGEPAEFHHRVLATVDQLRDATWEEPLPR